MNGLVGDLILLLVALVVCFGLSFFFSGAETAIISVNKYRLRSLHEQGNATAGKLLGLLANTQRLLVMVLIGNNIAGVLLALFFNLFLERGWPQYAGRQVLGLILWSNLLGLIILTPLVVIFAEILPKALFRSRADRMMEIIRPLILISLFLFKPLILIVERFTNLVLSPLSEQRTRAMRQFTRQDVINLINPEEHEEENSAEAEERYEDNGRQTLGTLRSLEARIQEDQLEEAPDERRMIQNIIELQERRACEIMTPLVDLTTVHLDQMDLEGFRQLARRTGYSRYPVFRDRIVNLIGYIDVYQVLRDPDPERKLEDFIENAHYIPESKRVDDLLQEFLRQRIKNAIVVNEYGGCSGWISREDMLEEIVGEMEDELDEPFGPIQRIADGSFLAHGRTEIDRINSLLGSHFTAEKWKTLAGLIMNEMGRLPHMDDEVVVSDWRIRVVKMTHHRVDVVKLTPVE